MQYKWMCVIASARTEASEIICSTFYIDYDMVAMRATGRLGYRKFIGMTALYAHRSCQMAKYYIIMYVLCVRIECIPNKCSFLLSQLIMKCCRRWRWWRRLLLTHCDSKSTKMARNLLTTDISRINIVTRWITKMRTELECFVRSLNTNTPKFRLRLWAYELLSFQLKSISNQKMLPKITKKMLKAVVEFRGSKSFV